MARLKDETGNRYGHLTVIGQAPSRHRNKQEIVFLLRRLNKSELSDLFQVNLGKLTLELP